MDKDALFHEPIAADTASWTTKRKQSERLDAQVQQFLAKGGSITEVFHPTLAEIKATYSKEVYIDILSA